MSSLSRKWTFRHCWQQQGCQVERMKIKYNWQLCLISDFRSRRRLISQEGKKNPKKTLYYWNTNWKTPKKNSGDSGLTPVARGGCGAQAPPHATRPRAWNEASSCPGIFSSTLRFIDSSPGSPLPHLLDGHRKLVGCLLFLSCLMVTLSFFLSLFSKTQPKDWTDWMENSWLATYDPRTFFGMFLSK